MYFLKLMTAQVGKRMEEIDKTKDWVDLVARMQIEDLEVTELAEMEISTMENFLTCSDEIPLKGENERTLYETIYNAYKSLKSIMIKENSKQHTGNQYKARVPVTANSSIMEMGYEKW